MKKTASETVICDDSLDIVFEEFYKNGWTDGLPIIPPTRERVDAMMSTVERAPDDVVASLEPKKGEAAIEKLAINAVMAGCLPAYFPVVVAAAEALGDPKFNLYFINTTTNPTTPMLIINGPIRKHFDINSSWGVFGPGWRANATIGRAITLILVNIAGRIPGEVSKSVIGHPGRYGMCIGEREEESPWEPLHVERGFKETESTVTLVSPSGVHQVEDFDSSTSAPLLKSLTGSLNLPTGNNTYPYWGEGEAVFIMCPGHAKTLAREGYSKQDVKAHFCETIKIPPHFFSEAILAKLVKTDKGEFEYFVDRRKQIEDGLVKEGQCQVTEKGVSLFARPDQLLIVVAGGDGGYQSAFCPTFGESWAVTRTIAYK